MFDELTAQFTWFDWVFVIWMAFSILLGLIRGFISEVLSLVGWVTSFVLGYYFAAEVGAKLPLPVIITDISVNIVFMAGFLVVFVGSFIAWAMVRTLFRFTVGKGFFDYVLGFIFGSLRGTLVAMVAISMASVLVALPNQAWWKDAYFHNILLSGVQQFRDLLPTQINERLQLVASDIPEKKGPVTATKTSKSNSLLADLLTQGMANGRLEALLKVKSQSTGEDDAKVLPQIMGILQVVQKHKNEVGTPKEKAESFERIKKMIESSSPEDRAFIQKILSEQKTDFSAVEAPDETKSEPAPQ